MNANTAIQSSQTESTSSGALVPPSVVLPTPPQTGSAGVIPPSGAAPQISTAAGSAPQGGVTAASSRRRPAAGNGDDALTTQDQTVLERLRREVSPRLKASASAKPNVNFILRNGVVILVGDVVSEEQRQQVIASVRGTAGVVSVVDELRLSGAAALTSPRRESIVNPSPSSSAPAAGHNR